MQGRIAERRIERFDEFEFGGVHQPRVEPLGPRRADHAQAIVDPDDIGAGLLDLEGQRAVAAADIEDMLARLRVEQVERRLPQRRHEPADASIIGRVPLRGRGDEDAQSVFTHSR